MEDLVQFYQCIPYSRLEQMNIGKNPFEHCMVEQKSCHRFLTSIVPHLWRVKWLFLPISMISSLPPTVSRKHMQTMLYYWRDQMNWLLNLSENIYIRLSFAYVINTSLGDNLVGVTHQLFNITPYSVTRKDLPKVNCLYSKSFPPKLKSLERQFSKITFSCYMVWKHPKNTHGRHFWNCWAFYPWSKAIFLKISQMQWNLDFFAILAKYVAGVAKK